MILFDTLHNIELGMNKTLPNENLKAGIFIPTMNRVDFVIRQLRYYASVQCQHTIYIGDSSPKEESEKIENEIKKLGNAIKAKYYYLPEFDNLQAHYHLIKEVRERYICYSGDDDYQIPDSITKCIEFLEANDDYSSASGYAVSFRLKQSGPYGQLKRLADYPRQQIEENTGAERIRHFFNTYFVTHFSVNRTAGLANYWQNGLSVRDRSFRGEIIPTSLPLISGKSKILDCLGFVRQIHDSHFLLPGEFDWVTQLDWRESYTIFEQTLSKSLAEKDKIPLEEATKIIRQSFLGYLGPRLVKEYRGHYPLKKELPFYWHLLCFIKPYVVSVLPFLKNLYRAHIKPQIKHTKEMHYEVLRTGSQYYKDFKPVMDSFTDSLPKNL